MTKLLQIFKNITSIIAITIFSMGLLLVSSTLTANAQRLLPDGNQICPGGNSSGCKVIPPSGAKGQNALLELSRTVATTLTFAIASICIIFILYGSWVWLSDLEKGAEKGRKIIINSVIALVISVVAYGVLATIIQLLDTPNLTGGGA
jgi:hypothetical protein